ncbi:hypothetical protein K0I63_14115 [Shewanella rhizosphaerae]|uniref:hypothetical protein n=1 Tax=Shewanella rhizosphaerae TaxID=2864207 RepID=UPI001C660150|nr:hypothetical protein [Shewanella rhizosphaerae]QYK11888.1 hypothetical protein K0I63_14115 [Shewanella rhizosphaerae]
MRSRIKIHIFASMLSLIVSNAIAETFPTISGNVSSQECSDALTLARSMFNSKSTQLYAPLDIPENLNSNLILGSSALDISGGAALEADQDQFEKVPQFGEESIRSVYWEKNITGGVRIAVKETSFGWRGDMYSLFLIDSKAQKNEFLQDLQESYGHSKYTALIGDVWRSPLIFLSKQTKRKWFMSVGQPYDFLAPWAIYINSSEAFDQSCTIKFRPDVKLSQSLLPNPVQYFAHLLDETMGPGNDEGTLQPTARLRNHVQDVWANAALRPWALSDSDTYNSTEEVNMALAAWSKTGSSYKKVYAEIIKSYPVAEKSLSYFYINNFNLSKNQAEKIAKWVLDIAYRAHYSFPNGSDYFRYDNVNTNPWDVKN